MTGLALYIFQPLTVAFSWQSISESVVVWGNAQIKDTLYLELLTRRSAVGPWHLCYYYFVKPHRRPWGAFFFFLRTTALNSANQRCWRLPEFSFIMLLWFRKAIKILQLLLKERSKNREKLNQENITYFYVCQLFLSFKVSGYPYFLKNYLRTPQILFFVGDSHQ